MSALGSTLSPGGETGTVTSLTHMPDQLPDNPSTIAATTSIETVEQVMYRNWIYKGNYTVDASMRSGHVFAVIKIHPKNCNDYISHLSEMFLTWTGTMSIRVRSMATFQYGGSLRIGWLPPKFSYNEVVNLPLSTLTAYPNIDLDPKNTDWVEFKASEERNILFHWMESLETETPESYGGHYVLYVASPVVQSGGPASISLYVETAGAFNMAQLSPLTSITPGGNGWLDNSACYDFLNQLGCDDLSAGPQNGIQICASTTHSILTGFKNAYAQGGERTYSVTPGGKLGPALASDSYRNDKPYSGLGSLDTDGSGDWLVDIEHIALNSENDSYHISARQQQGDLYTIQQSKSIRWTVDTASLVFSNSPIRPVGEEHTAIYQGSGVTAPINISKCTIENDDSTLTNMLPLESIVLFINQAARTINLQTHNIALSMKDAKKTVGLSQIYHVYVKGTTGPVLQLRLQPNGMLSTNPSEVDVLMLASTLTGPAELRYIQDLPMSSPLPPLSSHYRTMRLLKKCTATCKTPEEWRCNFTARMF
jgi:hypothetical protein